MKTIFFFKQKTAYEMRISDWSSDVCSSDLLLQLHPVTRHRFKTACVRGGDTDRAGIHFVAHEQQALLHDLVEIECDLFRLLLGRHSANPAHDIVGTLGAAGNAFGQLANFREVGHGPGQPADRTSTRLNSSP